MPRMKNLNRPARPVPGRPDRAVKSSFQNLLAQELNMPAPTVTREDRSSAPPRPLPLKPFITGFGLGAAWGALSVPSTFSYAVLGGFVARIFAIAAVSGGVLAVLVEAFVLLIRLARHWQEGRAS
jgi:hypothetical protein